MLQSMRDKMSGWVTGIIIGVISIIFVLWGIGSYFEPAAVGTKTIATVGSQKITDLQLMNALNNMRQRLLQQGVTDLNSPKWRAEALASLISRARQVAGAENLGVAVNPDQVDQAIYQIPQFMKDGQFSMDIYNQFIQNSGMTTATLKQYLSEQIMIAQVAGGLVETDFTLPNETKDFASLLTQKRDIEYAWVKDNDFAKAVDTSDTKLKTFYESHKQNYKQPAEVSIKYIKLSLSELAKDVKISESQAQQYYETYKNNYQTPEERKASQILLPLSKDASKKVKQTTLEQAAQIEKELSAGKSFSELAKKYSKDPLSVKKGGDMGWLTLPDQPNTFEKTLFDLAKVGDVSKPIETEYGIQIIKLTAIKPKEIESFSKVKDKIIDRLKKQKAEIAYSSVGNQLANLTFENPSSLEFAAKQLNLKVESTQPFNYKGLKEGVASNKKVIEAAFSDNVLKDKNNSDVINISSTEAVVVRLDKYTPEEVKPFNQVKNQVRAQLVQSEELNLAEKHSKELVSKLNNVKTQKEALSSLKLESIKGLTRDATHFSAPVVKAIFSSEISTKTNPSFSYTEEKGKGVLIYSIVGTTSDVDTKNMKMYTELLKQLQTSTLYENYLSYLKGTISVEKKDSDS